MKQWRKPAGALFAGLLSVLAVFPAQAASREKITSVNLTVTSEMSVGEDRDLAEIEIETRSDKYTVDDYEILNEGFEWEETDVPRIMVTLTAADNYYFSLRSSDVHLDGATYVKAVRQSGMDSTVLLITMDLPSMASRLGELEQVSLDEYGNASWSQAEGAGYYEVCVIRNATIVGGTQTVEGTSLNVGNLMTVPSNYTVKVRPVNKSDWNIKGRWVKSDSVYIDGLRAKEFKENGGVAAGQWLQDAQGWWFRNSDGSYTTENWQLIGGKWYYFDANGYMEANQWILTNGLYYYVGQDGAMLTDTYVPGTQYYVDSTGKWVE